MASESIQVMRSIDDRSAKQDQGVGVLKEPVCFRVPRNPEMPRDKPKDRVDELLVLEAVDIPGCQLALDVFINLPDADHKTPATVAEYVGSFYCISPRMSNQTFPIRANLEILGLEDAKEIVVTVVPKGTCQTEVPIKGARIVYD